MRLENAARAATIGPRLAASAPGAPDLWLTGSCDAVVWGLRQDERLKRLYRRATTPTRLRKPIALGRPTALVLRCDCILDDRLFEALARRPEVILVDQHDRPFAAHLDSAAVMEAAMLLESGAGQRAPIPAGCTLKRPHEILGRFDKTLRKSTEASVFRLDEVDPREVERRLFGASYKGVTDVITKYVWPVPAFHVTRLLAQLRVPANAVTATGLILCFVAAILWASGRFVEGLLAAWLMTFLDTVDGKLARVTLTTSEVGRHLDHLTDILHPPLWWLAWWWGAAAELAEDDAELAAVSIAAVLATYFLGRALELGLKWATGLNPFLWRPFDSRLRGVIARRNINLAILTVCLPIAGPVLGLAAVAAWSILTVLVQAVRAVQVLSWRRQGNPMTSWLVAG